jgi:phosphoglycolate phosphatase
MKNALFPSAMVFDWDNTLVDSWGAIGEAMNLTRVKFGLSQWTMKEIMANCTRAARESFPEWFGPDWKRAYDFYYQGFDEVRKKRTLNALPGAPELLNWLDEAQVPSFVVSNKRGDYLRVEAEKLGWQKHFVAIVGAQDAPRDKPAREHVDHALAKGGLTADASVWFVGDSETDVLCARNAGCTPVLIGHTDMARTLKVDVVFADCAGLQKLLYNRRNDKVT